MSDEPTNFIDSAKPLLKVIIVVLVLGLFGSFIFSKSGSTKTPEQIAQKQAEAIVLAVDRLIELPVGETPTVATISDKEKLKDQLFFSTAENGDTLLVYNTAMVAILYRPKTNKIINVAPISGSQENPSPVPNKVTSTPGLLRIAYYNGTKTVGLSASAEKMVKEKYPSSVTVKLTNASKRDYKKTTVVNISRRHNEVATNLALFLNAEVLSLPDGEVLPDADILIISGQ